MLKNINFYFLSVITLLFQFLFLSIIKEYENEFIYYIQIISLNQIIISFLGSIQFYLYEKSTKVDFNIYKFPVYFLIFTLAFLSIYYFLKDLKWFLLFISSTFSIFFLTISNAYFARFNKFEENTRLLLFYSFIKVLAVVASYSTEINVINAIIISNIIFCFYSYKFIKKINLKYNQKGSFSLISILNNILGNSNTTLDKLYCSKFAVYIAANYFLIFKVASIFQYFTEVIFRKERFIITEGKSEINEKFVYFKFCLLLFSLIVGNLIFKKYNLFLLNLSDETYDFIYSFIQIILLHIDEITIISFAFLINSLSGLDYDKIYRNYGNKKLFLANFLNTSIFIVLLFLFGDSVYNLAVIFLIIHMLNFVYIKILKLLVFKNAKY